MVDTAEVPSAAGSAGEASASHASSSENTQQQQQEGTSMSANGDGSDVALRLVLSPGSTPASSLLVPIRMKGMEPQQAATCRELEVCMCMALK
mgnify:CR=1 FL=1